MNPNGSAFKTPFKASKAHIITRYDPNTGFEKKGKAKKTRFFRRAGRIERLKPNPSFYFLSPETLKVRSLNFFEGFSSFIVVTWSREPNLSKISWSLQWRSIRLVRRRSFSSLENVSPLRPCLLTNSIRY